MTISTLVDCTQIYITSVGTVAMALGDHVSGFQGTDVLVDGDQYSYRILTGGDSFECGTGIYMASTQTLTRVPSSSSSGGGLIDVPANSQVAITILASDLEEIISNGEAASGAADEAIAAAGAALISRDQAANSAIDASVQAGNAADSAALALTHQNNAAGSAAAAGGSQTAAAGSATAAAGSATAAGNSQTAAAGSATAAGNSATAAGNSATAAAGSATAAGNSQTAAAGSATAANNSASSAAGSADAAQNSLTELQNNLPNFSWGVTTLAAGQNATLVGTGTYPNINLAFGVPRGNKGDPGDDADSPIFTTTTTTGAAGTDATVTLTGTYPNLNLAFVVPRGQNGTGAGTVTSINVGGGTTGFTFTGGPITSSGVLTMTVSDPATVRTAIGAAANTVATTGASGLMSNTDKTKLDGIAAGAQVNTVTSVAGRTGAITLAIADTAGLQAALDAKFNTPSGTTDQYVRGNGTLATFPTGLIQASIFTAAQQILFSTAANTPAVSDAVGVNSLIGRAASGNIKGLSAAEAATALGVSGSVVGTTGAQTLASKTLTNPTIDGYTEGSATATGAAFSPNIAADTLFYYTTNANSTITLPTPAVGKSFTIVVNYGGAHTLTWAGGARKWSGGTVPTNTSVSGKIDIFSFVCVDGTNWLAAQNGKNF